MGCQLLFDKQYCNALEQIADMRKEEEYSQIQAAGFDSEEIWDLWYDSDDDINTFIEYLSELEVQGLSRMNEMEDEE